MHKNANNENIVRLNISRITDICTILCDSKEMCTG